ncbi:UNVERIFIED_CONTAM: hypothetical protein Sindi_1265500, partial [Sesamum indicum]
VSSKTQHCGLGGTLSHYPPPLPSATQEVSASSFSQGLLDGYLFKSQAKNHVFKFNALLASAGKHINMEDAQ